MGLNIQRLLAVAAIAVAATATPATAQERPTSFQPRKTIPTAVDESYHGDTDSFVYKNLGRPIEVLIGVPGFPENLLARDGRRIHSVYLDLLNQQVASDPLIRTADLPNPYNTSLLTLPTSNRVLGSEFMIENPPVIPAALPPQPAPILPQRF